MSRTIKFHKSVQLGREIIVDGKASLRVQIWAIWIFITLMAITITGCASASSILESPLTVVKHIETTPHGLDATQFLDPDYMQSSTHRVDPQAMLEGYLLSYTIETPNERIVVIGTEQTKAQIREIYATAVLLQRSTAGTVLKSVKDRTTNLVETPYRVSKTLVSRASQISDTKDAVTFVPEQVGQALGGLLNGVKELTVTGARISKGAAGTNCSGLACVGKVGSDVWSGFNSLAGKHNASRRLHSEFGTDPETQNKDYRRQIDRLAYAGAYTSTTIKLGAGQAGINYISPAFIGVGYYNNAEFVGQYEDAHRPKNMEKKSLLGWGADMRSVDSFYQNEAFTKQYRRRTFKVLNAIPDKSFALKFLDDAAKVKERYNAEIMVVKYEYIATLAVNEGVSEYVEDALGPVIVSNDGTAILPLYADYLSWTPQLSETLQSLAKRHDKSAIHVLGYVDADVTEKALELGVKILELQDRGAAFSLGSKLQ